MAPTALYELPALASPLGIGALLVGVLALVFLAERFVFGQPMPSDMPLLLEPEGARSFSLRTRLRYYTDCEGLFREAYENYSKKGKPVIIPGLGFRIEVILPPTSMRWISSQPDNVLNTMEAFAEMDQVRWSLGHDTVIVDSWQGMLVKTEMNRVLENTCAAMQDELYRAFDAKFGVDTENWIEIDLLPTVGLIVAQAASRFTLGAPLCRDEEYLKLVISINNALLINAGVTGAMPRVLQPIVGRLFNMHMHSKIAKMKKFVAPLWESRLETLKHDRDDPAHDEPADHVQMMVRWAAQNRPHELRDLDLITRRIIANNFGSIHQTGMQVTNMLLNIVGSDAEFNTIAALRDETSRVFAEDSGGMWTKAKISQLVKADSVSRETLRLNSFGNRAGMRSVMKDGFVTDQGYALPKGTMVSFLGHPAQTDEETMEDPLKYDPFRFSRVREAAASRNEQAPALSFVTTSTEFLPFGHGKHACPGRFLIDFELKMIQAYVLQNYDLEFPDEYKGQRPPNRWMAEAIMPPEGAKIRVRRRKV